jgi:hypothetical protein
VAVVILVGHRLGALVAAVFLLGRRVGQRVDGTDAEPPKRIKRKKFIFYYNSS